MRHDLRRPSPAHDPNLESRTFGKSDGQPVRVFLFADVADELIFASTYEHDNCLAVLTGGFGVDAEGGFVEITGFTGMEYALGPDDEYEIIRRASDRWQTDGESEPVVGFFRSVRGGQGLLDVESARLHFSLFNVPFQIAIACDPELGRIGLFARNPAGVFVSCEFTMVRYPSNDESE